MGESKNIMLRKRSQTEEYILYEVQEQILLMYVDRNKVVVWEEGQCSSVQFSRSVVSESLCPHGPQHARLPCPSLTPGVY